jgi:hypothetical protein
MSEDQKIELHSNKLVQDLVLDDDGLIFCNRCKHRHCFHFKNEDSTIELRCTERNCDCSSRYIVAYTIRLDDVPLSRDEWFNVAQIYGSFGQSDFRHLAVLHFVDQLDFQEALGCLLKLLNIALSSSITEKTGRRGKSFKHSLKVAYQVGLIDKKFYTIAKILLKMRDQLTFYCWNGTIEDFRKICEIGIDMVLTLDHFYYDRRIKQAEAEDASLVTVDADGTIDLEPNDPVTLPLTIPEKQYTWFMRTHEFLAQRVTSQTDFMDFLRQKKKAQQSNNPMS